MELFALLFVLYLSGWVNIFVSKSDVIVEVFQDLLLCREVDWRAKFTELIQVVLLVRGGEFYIVRGAVKLYVQLLIEKLAVEFLKVARTLCNRVLEIL